MKALKTKEITTIAVLAALTAVLAQISIPIPISPVPISFGMVAVCMSGILLKPKHAVLAQITYLLIGAIGLPVFSQFRGGLGVLFGATGGYLMVYPIVACIIAVALNGRKREERKNWLLLKATLAICIAQIALYLGGTIWLCLITGQSFQAALGMAVYPYIPLDLLKMVFCIAVILPLRNRFRAASPMGCSP